MQPALDVYTTCCELVKLTCGCDGRWSRDGPILSPSSIMSIIVAFTGRVLWFSAIVVISRYGCENPHTLCNFSVWTVADVRRPIEESRAVAQKPRDAAVNFDRYRNVQQHRAVLPATPRLLFISRSYCTQHDWPLAWYCRLSVCLSVCEAVHCG